MQQKQQDLKWVPFYYFLARDISRFLKVKVQTIVTPLVSQAIYLLIFGLSLGKAVNISEQFSYLQFIIPGLAAMSLITQSFANGSSSIFSMKITGEIIDIKSTALNIQQIIAAVAISGLLRGLVTSCGALILGELCHFWTEGQFLPIQNVYFLFVFLFFGGTAFALLGFSVGIWSKTFDHVGAISSFVILPLSYLGGVFFDLDTLPLFWQKAAVLNPLFYFVDGVRYSTLGVSDIPILMSLLAVVLSLFGAYGIACLSAFKGTFQRAF